MALRAGAFACALCCASSGVFARSETWRCRPKPIAPCVTQHARLSSQNGIALTLWLIGTTRRIAVENEVEDLPAVLQKYLDMTSPNHSFIYGDFETCPVERDIPGHMGRACIAGASKLVVQDVHAERPPFRIKSTWR